MRHEQKLTELYICIHKGCVLTWSDLVFLAKYDMECYNKVRDRLVNDKPKTETKFPDKEPKMEEIQPVRVEKVQKIPRNKVHDEKNKHSIDMVIEGLHAKGLEKGIFRAFQEKNVLSLIGAKQEQDNNAVVDRRYTFYNPMEQNHVISARV